MRLFAFVVASSVLISTYATYIQQMLEIHWRTHMTRRFQAMWFLGQAYYKIQVDQREQKVDNPDQRIQEDVALFVGTVLNLFFGLLGAAGRFCVFLPILLYLSPDHAFGKYYLPGWLVYMALAYSLVGSIASHVIGRELIRVGFARQRYEADFRYHVVQIRA